MIQITENFFKDPYVIRNKAISFLRSDTIVSGDRLRGLKNHSYTGRNWPGKRYDVPDNIKLQILSKIESITNEKLGLLQSSFQAIDKSFMEGIVHCDMHAKYTCVIFLNLQAPYNTGLEIYDEKLGDLTEKGDMLDEVEVFKRKFYESNRTFIDKFIFKRTLNKVNSIFKDPCVVSNKFNRSVVFDGPLVHRAQNFCGNDINNSRLTIVSFFQ